MNLKTILLFIILFPVYSKINAQGTNFKLTFKSSKSLTGYKIFLYYIKGTDSNGVDSTGAVNGKFVINGKTRSQQQAFICLAPGNSGFTYNYTKERLLFYLEPGQVMISTDKHLTDAKVSGTPLNKDYQEYLDVLASFQPRRDSIERVKVKAYQQRDTALMEGTIIAFRALDNAVKKAEQDYFFTHLGSQVSLDWLKRNVVISKEKSKAEALFAKMSKTLKNTEAGKSYTKLLNQTASVETGNQAPDFTSTDLENKNVSLSSFRGKYVLLDFWASWCMPCRKENPNVIKAYNTYKSRNFTIVGFSLDDAKEPWIRAVEKDGLTWTQLCDTKAEGSPVSRLYGVTAIPSNFLIDPQGKIIARDLRGEELEKKLAAIFN